MIRIINFITIGDSLTVGFIPSLIISQPYSRFLKEKVDDFLKKMKKDDDVEVKFINRGVTGDLTSGMLNRFMRDVLQDKPQYVIILGGTNDIGSGLPVNKILLNLKVMFKVSLENNIIPIACTLPSVIGWDKGIPPRIELNQLLLKYCNKKGIFCVDLFTITRDPETNRLKYDFSSDGLHLNTLGYRKIAESIFEEAIKDLLVHLLK